MPEPGCGVTGSGDDAQSVGSRDQRDRRHEALVRFDPGEFIIGLGIPDPHRSISRPGDDDGAIRCHCHRGNRRLMPFKRVYFAARPHIPDARRLIKRAGNNPTVVERRHRGYGQLVTLERRHLLVGRLRQLPNPCRSIVGAGDVHVVALDGAGFEQVNSSSFSGDATDNIIDFSGITVTGGGLTMSGGDGNDALTAADTDDALNGNNGDDVLNGGL